MGHVGHILFNYSVFESQLDMKDEGFNKAELGGERIAIDMEMM